MKRIAVSNALENDFEFMTSTEITKSIAKKIKLIRKKQFKTQEIFAKHIGMSLGSYARFEKTGQISFKGFIEILKGVQRVDEISDLFALHVEEISW